MVDDDPEIRHVARFALEKAGHEVATAASGAEGLERARRDRPDAVLLDVLLPDESGEAVLRRMRLDDGLTHVPVVFLTGNAEGERADALRQSDVRGIVPKPFDPLELAGKVEELLGSSGAGSRG